MDEQNKCTELPKISAFKSKRKRIPVHKRKVEHKDYDEVLEKQRALRPVKVTDEEEQFTFEPDISLTKTKENRTVDDLLKWGTEKRFKLANQRLKKYEGFNYSFKPEIDKKSKKLAKKRKGDGRIEDRLIEAGKSAKMKREDLFYKQTKNLFKPDININSKKILKDKELLVKQPNGVFGKVDFFEAVARSEFDEGSLSPQKQNKSKKKKKRKKKRTTSKSGSRKPLEELAVFNFEDIRLIKAPSKKKKKKRRSDSKEGRRLEFPSPDSKKSARARSKERIEIMEKADLLNIINTTKNRNEEMLPTYVSPYNKVMLASGLPLKTIIKKTKKAKDAWKVKNERHNNRNKFPGFTGPTNSRSRSRKRKEQRSTSQKKNRSRNRSQRKAKRSKEDRNISAKQAFIKQMENEGLREMIKMDMMPLRQGKKFLKTRYTQEKRKKKIARDAKYGSPRKGIRDAHLPAYEGGTFKPEEWTKVIRSRNRSNSISRVRKLFYKDYSNRKGKSARKGRSLSNRKKAKEKKKKGHQRNTSHSPTPVYLRKYKNRGNIDGYDDYKQRLKFLGNTYMYESVENLRYAREQDMMKGMIRGIELR